jgi:hypothetical protein
MNDGEPAVPWLETPWDELTADQIEATPAHQLAMMAQRDMFARHGRLEEWERETRPVLWPELMPEGYKAEEPAPPAEEKRPGLIARIFGSRRPLA